MPIPAMTAGTTPGAPPAAPHLPLRAAIISLLVVVGAFFVVLAALPYKSFELDRHFVPKELALHLTAWLTAGLALIGTRRLVLTRVDTLLVAYLALSLLSAVFAPNWWLAQRALAMTSSGILLYWVARTLTAQGFARPLLLGIALAGIVGILTALAQAYGFVGEYASLSRAPGGTFGNRNFMAHLAAICVPVLIFLTVQGRKFGVWIGSIGLVMAAAGLVLSRTRAAWLALAVCALLCAPLLWRLTRAGFTRKTWIILSAVFVGSLAALLLPNRLNWKSDSPYLDSVKDVVNYKEGSGHGRIKQYTNSLKIVASNPIFGVGPGNWPVVYPTVAPRNDKSLDQDTGMTSNPWPSSDWVAMISERGIPATIVFVLAWIGLLVGAWRQWRISTETFTNTSTDDERAQSLTLIATLIVTALTGTFDAVLLIAIPSLFVWILLGVLTPTMPEKVTIDLAGTRWRWMMIAMLVTGTLFSLRSAGQIYAMSIYDSSSRRAVTTASRFDPGSYRIQIRLAELHARRGDCPSVKESAGQAHALFPEAPEPRRLLKRCGVTLPPLAIAKKR